MKAFKEWLDGVYSNDELYNAVLPQIRSNPHLVDEFSVFFEDKKPPQRCMAISVTSDYFNYVVIIEKITPCASPLKLDKSTRL